MLLKETRIEVWNSAWELRKAVYLEVTQAQLKHQPLPLADILWGEGEHRVMNTEQGDEEERGTGKTSVNDTEESWSFKKEHHSIWSKHILQRQNLCAQI